MIESLRTFFEQLPKIISVAAKNALGIIALMILSLSILSLFLFNQASDDVKVLIYVLTIVSFLVFVVVVLRVAGPISSSNLDINKSKSIQKQAPIQVDQPSPLRHMLPDFTVRKAQEYARVGRIEEWVHNYLNRPQKGAKPQFSLGLKTRKRWWNGPLEIRLTELNRVMGPELYIEYTMDSVEWARLVTELVECCTDPLEVPPLLVHCYTDLNLSIRHGDAWFEAMRWKGWQTCWVIIWYDTETDYRRHTKKLIKAGYLPDQDKSKSIQP